MPDYNVQELLPVEFPMRNKVMVPIDADLVAYFQSETEPSDWQGNINGVLRFYMETNLSREAEFQAALAAGPADGPAM